MPLQNVSRVGNGCDKRNRVLTQSQVVFLKSLNGGVLVFSSRPNLRHLRLPWSVWAQQVDETNFNRLATANATGPA